MVVRGVRKSHQLINIGGLNECSTPQLLIPQLHTGSIASPIKVGNGGIREWVLSRPLGFKRASKLV